MKKYNECWSWLPAHGVLTTSQVIVVSSLFWSCASKLYDVQGSYGTLYHAEGPGGVLPEAGLIDEYVDPEGNAPVVLFQGVGGDPAVMIDNSEVSMSRRVQDTTDRRYANTLVVRRRQSPTELGLNLDRKIKVGLNDGTSHYGNFTVQGNSLILDGKVIPFDQIDWVRGNIKTSKASRTGGLIVYALGAGMMSVMAPSMALFGLYVGAYWGGHFWALAGLGAGTVVGALPGGALIIIGTHMGVGTRKFKSKHWEVVGS